jgi:hypothetical protein
MWKQSSFLSLGEIILKNQKEFNIGDGHPEPYTVKKVTDIPVPIPARREFGKRYPGCERKCRLPIFTVYGIAVAYFARGSEPLLNREGAIVYRKLQCHLYVNRGGFGVYSIKENGG